MTKQQSKQQIQKLVEKYQRVKEAGKIKSYNEAQTRNEFIEPLFEYLGWDMRNYVNDNEVTTEENVSGGRADLAFRIGSIPKFYLEAKSMKTDLDIDTHAKQTINYAWNKSVTWAVLTDFESIKVFNAQSESTRLIDKLVFEISCDQFISDFDRLWLLSKQAFQNNELDDYAEKYGKKQKSLTVNEKLYADLKSARIILAKSFDTWNSNINPADLDEGIQRILDRLIFIRVLEDRNLEPQILKPLIRIHEKDGQKQIFQMLTDKFRELDKIYNSNLFRPHACEKWEEYDDAIQKVILMLYGNDVFVYNFKEIPADILGGVYESYLGYISQKKATDIIKDSHKRKEQGIYYTPKYIVDFIVKNTLGKKLQNVKSINELKQIKVLDPACGSGSFLTAAVEEINNKYKDFNAKGDQLTKSSILLENIYGVDLDSQATEIAKLNLLIDALDEKEKLPDLTRNVRVGNSLISEGDEKLKPFNWKGEFKEVFEQGGFDVIIGNPPYIKEYTNRSVFDALHNNPYYQGKMDIWTLFACQAIDLLKDGGYFSFIAPNNWLTNAGANIFRDKILTEGQIIKFVDFGDFKVFKDAGIQTMIFVFKKGKPKKNYQTSYAKITDKNISEDALNLFLQSNFKVANDGITKFDTVLNPQQTQGKNITFSSQSDDEILNKIEAKKNFELTEKEVAQGIVAAPDKYFIVDDTSKFDKEEQEFIKPFYTSTAKYTFNKTNSYIFYLCNKNFNGKNLNNYPNIKNHFEPFKKLLKEAKNRYGTPDKPYLYLHREREECFFQKGPKVVGQARTAFPSFLYTKEEYYGSRAMNFIKSDRINLKYLTGLLNSRISYFWLKNKGKQLGDLLQIDKGPLLSIPLIKPNQQIQKNIALLVDKVIKLYQDFYKISKNSDKWYSIKKEITDIENQIDQMVYKLYDLTPKEIKIVEGAR